MQSLVSLNADVMQHHQPLVDSLMEEAAALRQEEIQFAHAFAKLPKELQTPELFELFFRDIHSAHAELVCRLNDILESKVSEALARYIDAGKELCAELQGKKQVISNLSENINQVRGELAEAPKILRELYRTLDKKFRGFFGGMSQEEAEYLQTLYHVAESMRKQISVLTTCLEVAEQAKK